MAMTLEQALARFGVVTVMEPYFFEVGTIPTVNQNTGLPTNSLFHLDSLRISNFTQEGPTKTAKGGLNAETIFRYGKTARLEMEDVIGRIDALKRLMGLRLVANGTTVAGVAKVDTFVSGADQSEFKLSFIAEAAPTPSATVNGATVAVAVAADLATLSTPASAGDVVVITYQYEADYADTIQVTEKFEKMVSIWGRTFVIDQATGTRQYINIWIPKFLPDALFNMTMEAEGDFGVISLTGDLFTDDCGVFYEFTKGTQPASCL